jgi:glycosyltransferase involved in cell wall biosynthesis
MQKSLSIVIPARNEERHIRKCLDAIAAQTIKPDEVIVVDNDSSDKTAEVARSYPFVKVLHEPKKGIVFARDRGFDAVKSDIIARLDADTVLPPTWVARVLKFYSEPDNWHKAVTGGCYFYNLHTGHLTGRSYDLVVFRFNRLLLGHYFPWGSNSALPREAWAKVRGEVCQKANIHEDLDLGFHLNKAGYKIEYKSNLRVGAVARRVVTERGELWEYLAMWPRTFRANGSRKGLLAWPLAIMVWLGRYWIFATEKVASLFD